MNLRFGPTLFAVTFISMISSAQNIIENPAKPAASKAGRVVTLREEMRIEDTGRDFTLKSVWDIKAAPDGTIFVKDGNQQILQFDSKGKFIQNLIKKGQGPGELNSVDSFLLTKDKLFLQGTPPKILAFDLEGKYVEEISLQTSGSGRILLVGASPDAFYLSRSGRPNLDQGTGWKDLPNEIIEFSPGATTSKVIGIFPVAVYVQIGGGGAIGWTTFKSLIIVPFDETTFLANRTPEYEVAVFDATRGTVLRRFKRAYPRVVAKRAGGVSGSINGRPGPEPPKYWSDIIALYSVGGRIWVQTSTVDAKKGVLFDVFDPEGRYVDCFYLKYSDQDLDPNSVGKRFTFANGFVYFSETNEADLIVIKKCSLVGPK